VGGNELEATEATEAPRASLGKSLIKARERRGLSRQMVVEQTHIPAHYVQMLEDDDYRRISDQLYLLPFLRKYADFLDIDPDETAMRLLREVQRVDNNPSSVRLDEPLDGRRYRRRNWSKPIMFGGLVAVMIGAYIAQSRHADLDNTVAATRPHPSQAVGSASSLALKGTTDSLSAVQPSSTASALRSDLVATQQATRPTKTPTHPADETLTQAAVTQVRNRAEPPNARGEKTSGVRQASNH
jgi:cytoskeletal protein RodZ